MKIKQRTEGEIAAYHEGFKAALALISVMSYSPDPNVDFEGELPESRMIHPDELKAIWRVLKDNDRRLKKLELGLEIAARDTENGELWEEPRP